jgi:PAS domain S-box-containing protein
MEIPFNKLLTRQLKRHFGSLDNVPNEVFGLLVDINNTYNNYEDDSHLLENSIEVSSQELRDAYEKHKRDAESQKETINKIKEAIYALNPLDISDLDSNDADNSNSNYLFESLIKLIEEGKEAQQEILKLSKAVEQNPSSIVITNIDGDIEYVNPKFCQLTGYTKEEVIGQNPRILKSENTTREFFEDLWNTILSGNEWHGELQNRKKNGDLYWESASISPLINDHGDITHFIAIKEDITERRNEQQRLVKSMSLLNASLESTADGLLVVSRIGNITMWNQKFVDMWDVPLSILENGNEEDLLTFFDKRILDNKPFRAKVNELYARADKLSVDIINLSDGRVLERYSQPQRMENNIVGRVWSFREITLQKQAEARLINSTNELQIKNSELDEALTNAEAARIKADEMAANAESANKSKSLFLANMSHEIRTPLNAIIGFSQLMNRDPQLTHIQKEYNISIISAGEHLLALINDILELSKVEAGRVVLNPTNLDLQILLKDIHMIFKERAKSKHLQFLFEIAEDIPQYVVVDEGKLRQIFFNLIGNAIKFTDQGGVAVRVRADDVDNVSGRLVVEIQDSGPGIPENEIGSLFKHFVQTSSGMRKGSGTGLGLALSRELALLMGGNITVTSEVGKGSVFSFFVDIKEGNIEAVEKVSLKRVVCIENTEKSHKILVVDDKKENLQVAISLLKLVGFETNEAINGQDAIVKFEEWSPDLILMDLRMPIMDGYEATRQIKLTEKGMNTPIIALTASAFEEDQKKTKLLKMQGYIRKPFRENDLFNTIGKILGIKYIYEEDALFSEERYVYDDEEIVQDIAKIPDALISTMQHAVSVADLDQLLEIIDDFEPEYDQLSKYLRRLIDTYDYAHLQLILNR